MKNQAYIINEHNQVVAAVETDLKNGAPVSYGFKQVDEFENGETFKGALINKRNGKISRAKKWGSYKWRYTVASNTATRCQFDDEFLIH